MLYKLYGGPLDGDVVDLEDHHPQELKLAAHTEFVARDKVANVPWEPEETLIYRWYVDKYTFSGLMDNGREDKENPCC